MFVDFSGYRKSHDKKEVAEAFGDCLLGIINGDCTVEEVKNLFFHGKTDDQIKKIPYTSSFVQIERKENQNEKTS